MEGKTVTTIVALVVASVFLGGGMIETSVSAAAQNDRQAEPGVEIIPNHSTVLQNESASLAVQIRNRANSDQFVLVRVYEPPGVSGMRVDGDPPTIRHNNRDMWQSSETMGPRQRLAVPITIEPGSDADNHSIHVQVKYFEAGDYTGKWEKGSLVVGQCSATCVARGTVKAVLSFLVEFRNSMIALLSLVVAILSLVFASVRAK